MTAPTEAKADEIALLRSTVKRLLAERNPEPEIRRTMETDDGYNRDLWQQLSEIGVTGLLVGEEFGGAGLGPRELGHVSEELGAALYGGPFSASSVISAALLNASDDSDARRRLLPGIANGRVIATVALTGPSGTWTPDGVAVTADGSSRLTGSASYVMFGNVADIALVVARSGGGFGLFEVNLAGAGVTAGQSRTVDRTMRLATVGFENAQGTPVSIGGWENIERALDVARVALASEQAGAGSRLFDSTVEYIRNRYQFGRAVGGFQALKHMAADLLIERESAISAARHAAEELARDPAGAQEAINLAAFACKDAFSRIAADAVQMHGGIAFTWEFPVHLYLRRARSTAQLLGSPAFYRERYLRVLEAKA